MKVKLISHTKDPEQVCAAAIRQCYSAIGAKELKQKLSSEERKKLITMVLGSGHTSTLEHASFTFAVEGVSRVTSLQLVRHRIASYSEQSHRYVDLSKNAIERVVPKSISVNLEAKKIFSDCWKVADKTYRRMLDIGIRPEDARYVLPVSVQSKLVVTMNARALLHFFELRCCERAQWEIRELANKMLALARKKAPIIFASAGPTCLTQKVCWEGKMSCGRWKNISGAVVRTRV